MTARRPGLDGLRAVAVTAVVLYHADHRLAPGGFLGVDLFFVLSGYLITTLLVAEHARSGRVALGAFWLRRVRRLWPSAWVTLAVVALVSPLGVWGADRQRTLPAELGAAFAHIANWFQIDHGGYVAQFAAPSPVRHFWSLAIEEQFYLVWPLVIAALLAGARPRSAGGERAGRGVAVLRTWIVPGALAVMAAGSIAAGVWHRAEPDRAYLGTDVRLVALVVGGALAWATVGRPLQGPASRSAQQAVAVASIAALVAFGVGVRWFEADSPWLSTGGFALVAVGCAVLVFGAVTPGPLVSALTWRPLVHLGRVSFALYLVHWPLLVALGPGRAPWLRLLVGGPAALLVAEVLHRVVERPILERRGTPRTVAIGAGALTVAVVAALLVSIPEGPTPTEQVEEALGQVPDPAVPDPAAPESGAPESGAPESGAADPGAFDPATPDPAAPVPGSAAPTTTCPPATTPPTPLPTPPAGRPGSSAESAPPIAGFDPGTVDEIPDPGPTADPCVDQIDVLVVGDSTGRGAANGLARLADPRIRVWDRTVLGCSYGDEACPAWREVWREAIDTARPDVVIVYAGVVSDLHGVDDAPFLSDRAVLQRAAVLGDAVDVLSAGGAQVLLTTVAVPLRPNGLFFCQGERTDSHCDPAWVDAWNQSIRRAAAGGAAGSTGAASGTESGAGNVAANEAANEAEIADVAGWIAARGSTAADRPDGLHLAGAALVDQARWLVPQLVAAGTR